MEQWGILEQLNIPYLLLSDAFEVCYLSEEAEALFGPRERLALENDFLQGSLRALAHNAGQELVRIPLLSGLTCFAAFLGREHGAVRYLLIPAREKLELGTKEVYAVLHDMRAAIAGITAAAQMLGNSDLREKEQRYLHAIKSNAMLLEQVTGEVMDTLAVEGDAERLHYQVMDGVYIVEDIVEIAQLSCQELGVRVSFSKKAETAPIKGDSILLERVIMNLVSNAVKFMATELEIEVSVRKEMLFITIKDNGIGMTKEQKKQIFNLFYSTSKNKERRNGYGVGLYTVRNIVEGMAGSIAVQTKLHFGTTFRLSFPLATEGVEAAPFLRGSENEDDRRALWTRALKRAAILGDFGKLE